MLRDLDTDFRHVYQAYAEAQKRANRPAQTEQQPVAWRWMYNGEPDGPYAFNYPLPDDDVVQRGLMAERPRTVQPLYAAPIAQTAPQSEQSGKFAMHQRVRKTSGSEWQGRICGTYSTALTPEGYAVESEAHAGSVQIYPAKALEAVDD